MINCVSYPNQNRNYCIFDEKKINSVVMQRENALPQIQETLEKNSSETEVLECLYELNIMLDNGVKDIEKMYPVLSKYNNTKSPYIQTYLAGIYRKTKIPDAFGPLLSMLIKNSVSPPENCYFDPNEEIGGAVLDYLA